MKTEETMIKMISRAEGNLHDIEHFLKVWGYARTISKAEELSSFRQEVVETAAIVHDISCPYCRRKYGSAPWDKQEAESAALLAEFFQGEDMAGDVKNRVVYLVSHYHTPALIDDVDFQILIEADYLVNASEHGFSKEKIKEFGNAWFRTETGRKLLQTMFLSGDES